MNKTVKGTFAAGTAAVLLLGGAGSLAYWQDSAQGGARQVDAGAMKLVVSQAGAWELNGAAVANPQAVVAVPGDEFVYTGSYVVTATGDNLKADLDITEGEVTGNLAGATADDTTAAATVTSAFALGTTPLGAESKVTSKDDGKTLAVKIVIDFPFGDAADNTSQRQTLNLTDYTVTLTQSDASPVTPAV
jgi:alternate signal-mediated exported protein